MDNNGGNEVRKKRPPMQLYVPPAQRASRLISPVQKETLKNESCSKNNRASINNSPSCTAMDRTGINSYAIRKERKHIKIEVTKVLEEARTTQPKEICCSLEEAELLSQNSNISSSNFIYQCNYKKMFNLRSKFPYIKLLIYSIRRYRLQWIQKYGRSRNAIPKDYLFFRRHFSLKEMYSSSGINIFLPNIVDYRVSHYLNEEYLTEFQNSYCTCGSRIFLYLPNYNCYYYQLVPDFEIIDHGLMPEDYLHCYQENEKKLLYMEEYINKIEKCLVVPELREQVDLFIQTNSTKRLEEPSEVEIECDSKSSIVCANKKMSSHSDFLERKYESKEIERVIVLDERIESPKLCAKSPQAVNNRNKQNEHDQEKEIMRKAKQNINRKTRPIIKYVDEDNHTLTIEKSDISNWEDLFNDEGELQDELLNEVVEKVNTGVSVFRTTGDDSSSECKPIEELEHVVELYGFPSTLETHDIISGFSELNTDSMYVKWVDDTHALLVLGSYIQAQKAVGLSNSLIKVRPMSVASSIALDKANRLDLKPAMKRPQTNLQTARRLITTHLGAKSKISKEQNEKEKEDLRAAKELKKQAKQNEKAAWEGNLRSSIN